MSVIATNRFACNVVNELADAFIDSELRLETDLRLLTHLNCCSRCRELIEQKVRMKRRVRESVEHTSIPAALRRDIYLAIRVNQTCQ